MRLLLFTFLLISGTSVTPAAVIEIRTPAELKAVQAKPVAGDVWKIHPGEYPGHNHVAGVAKLTVEAADPKNPPLFQGGSLAW